ncbi:molybdopterin biosynthesis protein [Marispirochaeta aestuarii]|uniref:molybdopterin biosynthesis protein n=1 Tax=Marispirochaeta aestuarii TaxID=1963862 RepID=UPI0029C8848A|nr:molybdopterin biosynthesis protein [Marispirochaeta aestuarii]
MQRRIYLDDIPLPEARERMSKFLQNNDLAGPMEAEKIPLSEAAGRITAEPVWASLSSPGYHASAMDGYAVKSKESSGATETSPVRIPLGPEGPASYVDTGDPMPPWADAVVMIENAELVDDDKAIEIRAAVAPWTSVRPMGEDLVATELVLPANHCLSPVDLGAIAGSGHATVSVRRKPVVVIIPTGTELISPEEAESRAMKPGEIIEYNSLMLAAQVESWGGEARRYSTVIDDPELIRTALGRAAAEADLVVMIAGSSAGSEDYSASVIGDLGEVFVHGIAVKPGHPVILGMVKGTPPVPVIGSPGYPVSCALTGEIFIEPILSQWLGRSGRQRHETDAVMSRKLHSAAGAEEFVRVALGEVDGKTVAAPLQRGAGVISSLVKADGILRIPTLSEGVDAGEMVRVSLLRDPAEIRRTIVHIGSHDICLDVLAQYIAGRSSRFTSSNAGSLGGLVALKRGEAHVAGSHLLDPATGSFNDSYIRRYLSGEKVVVISFVHREQGLITAKGNPKGIRDFSDLSREDLRYVNRQRGAGTRVLLDYNLEQLGIDPEQVPGYQREEYTHLAVAAAVQSGAADCGLGIAAAAMALDLDFVPLAHEQYELVTLERFFEGPVLKPLLEVLEDQEFRKTVDSMAGYSTADMGRVRKIEA